MIHSLIDIFSHQTK